MDVSFMTFRADAFLLGFHDVQVFCFGFLANDGPTLRGTSGELRKRRGEMSRPRRPALRTGNSVLQAPGARPEVALARDPQD